MRTRLRAENPQCPGRHGFAWEQTPASSEAHLDFGCHDGAFLASLRAKGIKRLAGLDVSREAVEAAHRRFPDLDVRHIAEDAPIPFPDGAFTSVTLLDVLEHVYDQAALLGELRRVLRSGGRLIVTVPRRYLFSFLDLGNLKFRFPRLHRWFFCLAHSRPEYDRRYVSHPDGLVGDISARKRWHEHFSEERLAALLGGAGFEVIRFDGAGFFTRPLGLFLWLMERLPGLRRLGRFLEGLDARWFESMNLFCVAARKDTVAPAPDTTRSPS